MSQKCLPVLILAAGSFVTGLFAGPAAAFDKQTTAALQACHDYVWNVPEFSDLPNAAVSVFPGILGDTSIVTFWNVYWDDPDVRRAGNCTVIDGAVEGFEDYSKLD